MGATDPDRVRIGNWNYAGVPLFLGLGVFPAFLGLLAWGVLTGKFTTKTGETDLVFLICIGGSVTFGAILMLYHALTYPVLWIEFGDRITYRNPLLKRSHEWSDISSLYFEDEQSKVKTKLPGVAIPLGKHRILVVILRNKKDLRVKVNDAQEAAIKQLSGRYQGPAGVAGAG